MTGGRRLVAFLIGVGLLAGCSSSAPDVTPRTSTELQAAVQDIGAAAAAGHYAAAATLLDTLQSRLSQALAAHQVTADRGARIQAAIDQVRGDLAALVAAATPSPAPAPSTSAPPASSGAGAGAPASPGKHRGKGKD